MGMATHLPAVLQQAGSLAVLVNPVPSSEMNLGSFEG